MFFFRDTVGGGDGVRPRSYRGTRPRFASGTLMSLRTTPPLHTPARLPEMARRVFRKRPQGVSPDALRSEARRKRSVRVTGAPA